MLGLMEITPKVKPSIPLVKNKSIHKMTLRSLFKKRNVEIGDSFRFEKSKKKRKKDGRNSDFRDDREKNRKERELDRYYIKWDGRFVEYLDDIEKITGKPMVEKQRKLIEDAVKNNKYMKLTPEQNKKHRMEYSSKRKDLIQEWERHTGETWGRYTEDIYNKNGKLIRRKHDLYDFHHIILSSYSGNNEWWNGFPAKHPNEHPSMIHRKGGLCDTIFKQ